MLDLRVTKITEKMKIAAAQGIADAVSDEELNAGKIVPDAFNKQVPKNIRKAVRKAID